MNRRAVKAARSGRIIAVLLSALVLLLIFNAAFNLRLLPYPLSAYPATAPLNYNGVQSTASFQSEVRANGFNPAISSTTVHGCGSTGTATIVCTGGTSLSTPVGMADFTWPMNGPITGPLYFNTKMPGDLSTNCDPGGSGSCSPTGTYGATFSFSGSGFVPENASSAENRNSPLPVAGTSSTPPVVIGGQTILPIAPCYPNSQIGGSCSLSQLGSMLPGSYCLPNAQTGQVCNPYMIYNNYTSSTPFNSTYNLVTKAYQAYYVGRYFAVIYATSKGSATLSCVGGCAGNFLGNAGEFTQDFASATAALNHVSLLRNTILEVVISVPAFWVNSNLDFQGIYGAWYGLNSNNIYTGTCTSTTCNTGQSDHSPIGIYKDPALATPAFSSFASLQPLNQYTTAQLLLNNLTATLNSQVFIPVSIQTFGHTYSPALGTNCTPGGPVSGCWAGDDATVDSWSIPLIFDTMGSRSVFQTSYVQVNPVFGTGSASGKILDGSSWLCVLNLCPPLAGATIQAVSGKTTVSQADGTWSLSGLAAGSQPLCFSGAGFASQCASINCPQAGGCSNVPGIVVLQPLGGFGNICIIQPSYLGGGFCPPVWVVVGIGIVASIIVGAFVLVRFAPTQTVQVAAGLASRGLRRRS